MSVSIDNRIKDIEKLIIEYRRRLQALQEKQAMYGPDTEPSILAEIEDVKASIEELGQELTSHRENQLETGLVKSQQSRDSLEEALKQEMLQIKRLIEVRKSNLNILQKQAAHFGIETPPHILIEIEAAEEEIEMLRQQLKSLEEDQTEQAALKSKQRIQIYLQGDFATLSEERMSVAIAAFAAIMDIPPNAIKIHEVYEG